MCFRMGLLVFGGQLVQGLEPLGLTRLNRRKIIVSFGVGLLVLASAVCRADPRTTPNCQKVVLLGEVNEGQKWSGRIGEGWVFRIIPIQPAQANFSGWDPVVDRDKAAGFPDALFLATPLYDSIDEHEVGTTFELRAPGCDWLESAQLSSSDRSRVVSDKPATLPAHAPQRSARNASKRASGKAEACKHWSGRAT